MKTYDLLAHNFSIFGDKSDIDNNINSEIRDTVNIYFFT
jgi:hypothetical protein